ncbi:MAG: hypothetical protein ACOYJG_02865 [Prevotella sp.]|jgi:hypothetical protein
MKRLQNRIAESRFALPVAAVYALLVCLANHLISQSLWPQLLVLALSTLLMVQLNSINALIRIYSRMVSCSFLVLTSMVTFVFPQILGAVMALCFIGFLLIVCYAYQKPRAAGTVFYAFCCIGIASLFSVHVLWYLPILWIVLTFNIMALSARTFVASLLGLLTPYWFSLLWFGFTGNMEWYATHFMALADFSTPFDLTLWNTHQLVTFIFIILLALISAVHFFGSSYKDKIRTRMIFEMLLILAGFTMLFLLLQPTLYDPLIRIFIITTSPLVGHYLALTNSRVSNVTFIIMSVLALGITFWNLWI